jgi:two-component system phosphate regulon response regulator OmpR
MTSLLLVDDDARLAAMLVTYLAGHGFRVEVRGDVRGGLLAARRPGWDAVLLDAGLPDGDGFELCRTMRGEGLVVPIVMLTARGEDTDRILGLELGADDYLPKPFNPRELVARLRAVLRRSRPATAQDVLRYGRLEIDRGARVARRDGVVLALTAHQFDLLLALAERPGRVLTREQLHELVRGEELSAFDRSIDVHVSRIRALVEDDPRHPRRILTARGAGYRFVDGQE